MISNSLRTIAIRKNAINSQLNQINKSISSLSLSSSPSISTSTCTSTHPSLTTTPTRSLHSSTSSFNQSTSTSTSSSTSTPSSSDTPISQHQIWESISASFKSSNPSNLKSSSSSSSTSFQSFVQAAESNFKRRITLGQSSPNDPTSGRQILVNKHEVEKAYRQLSSVIKRNNLRWELKLGERYEKPNETKRRRRSERHRRRFKDLVRSKVQLAMALKARGA